uniref:protein-tyrosine-phosphatase n=1 Tax=Timema monikensis TaxID=170555 RepID=A0A7R9HTE5_9NEOP|nr:unnamed protein product [Timema monikensis]
MSEEGVTKKRPGSEKQKGASANLQREDFGAGPTNLDCIEPGLWLGNVTAATDDVALEQRRINHILTVDSCPLPRKIVMQQGIKTLFIQVTDTPREDLLSHFEDTYRFISEGQEQGVVLVHCYFGVSRSATIVIAYMMKKHGLSFEDALERVSPALGRYTPQLSPGTQSRVKSRRMFVGPNPGFQSQLRLYHVMGWKIDRSNDQFRLFRLHVAADMIKKAKILPQSCMDVIKSDPALITVRPEPVVYRCHKCRYVTHKLRLPQVQVCNSQAQTATSARYVTHMIRLPQVQVCNSHDQTATSAVSGTQMSDPVRLETARFLSRKHSSRRILASASNLLPHNTKQKSLWVDGKWLSRDKGTPALCSETYFVEPLAWMSSVPHSLQGKLHCPKCQNKLGSFSWLMGCQCPCGSKISPAFYLVPSKVEWSNMVQNVQVTV